MLSPFQMSLDATNTSQDALHAQQICCTLECQPVLPAGLYQTNLMPTALHQAFSCIHTTALQIQGSL